MLMPTISRSATAAAETPSAQRLPGVAVTWCHVFVLGGSAEAWEAAAPTGGAPGEAAIGWVGGLPCVGWLGGGFGGCTGGCSDMAVPFTPSHPPSATRRISENCLGIAYER
jgi:hypothetical protein